MQANSANAILRQSLIPLRFQIHIAAFAASPTDLTGMVGLGPTEQTTAMHATFAFHWPTGRSSNMTVPQERGIAVQPFALWRGPLALL